MCALCRVYLPFPRLFLQPNEASGGLRPAEMQLLSGAAWSRRPDCFAQGQRKSCTLIRVAPGFCVAAAAPGKPPASAAWNLTSIAHHAGDHQLPDWNFVLPKKLKRRQSGSHRPEASRQTFIHGPSRVSILPRKSGTMELQMQ